MAELKCLGVTVMNKNYLYNKLQQDALFNFILFQ
jgi:hypothetical protein